MKYSCIIHFHDVIPLWYNIQEDRAPKKTKQTNNMQIKIKTRKKQTENTQTKHAKNNNSIIYAVF
jgi:hypothetical protein